MGNSDKIPSKITNSFKSVKADLLQSNLIGGDCVEYNQITVSHNTAIGISTIRAIKPQLCMVTVEKDPTATADIVCRFTPNDAQLLSPTVGMPLGDGGVIWVRGNANINQFKIMGAEVGKNHKLHLSFFA